MKYTYYFWLKFNDAQCTQSFTRIAEGLNACESQIAMHGAHYIHISGGSFLNLHFMLKKAYRMVEYGLKFANQKNYLEM